MLLSRGMTEERMADLRAIFESFERRIIEVLRSDKELFLPGIDRDRVTERLSGLPLTPPESLYELYAWHNGFVATPVWGDLRSLPMQIEHVVIHYQILIETAPSLWDARWLPVFTGGARDYWGVECGTGSIARDGRVISFDIDYVQQEPPEPAFDGIEQIFTTLSRCLDEGILFRDNAGELSKDFDRFDEVAVATNRTRRGDDD
jgi:hypothetical protein